MLESLLPNWERHGDRLITATIETLQMAGISGLISFILGIAIGVLLVVCKKGGLLENLFIYNIFDKVINVIRSIPFLILLILLIPVSRAIVGTGIGVTGAILALVVGTTPFFARQIESAIAELDSGLIEAALAMGMSPFEIIVSVYLRESIPSITRVTQITMINLIALTTIAGGPIAAGGIGDFAVQFGERLGLTDLLWVATIIILVMVSIIQGVGNIVIKYSTK